MHSASAKRQQALSDCDTITGITDFSGNRSKVVLTKQTHIQPSFYILQRHILQNLLQMSSLLYKRGPQQSTVVHKFLDIPSKGGT